MNLMKRNAFTIIVYLALISTIAVMAGDGKTFKHQGWTITLPGNWNGDAEAGLFWPGKGGLEMGRPATSLHCGGFPLMPGTKFEDRVKTHINAEPQDRKDVTVEGLKGFTCTWESQGKKHFGMFLEEVVGGGMSIINFFDCQSPADVFAEDKSDFEQIINNVKK